MTSDPILKMEKGHEKFNSGSEVFSGDRFYYCKDGALEKFWPE
jgi:hypothetical protein